MAVLRVSEAFASVWEELAGACAAEVREADSLEALAPLGSACAIVVASGGAEAEGAGRVAEIVVEAAAPVALVGAEAGHRAAVRALQAGADEYFALPADVEALRSWLSERVMRWRAERRAEALAEQERALYDFSRLIGRSPDLLATLERAARIIPRSAATILLTGETGTGKELLAQAIHYNGPRGAHPFVEVNCTALPPTLLEAELFGYERGAFTDARAAKPGLFEAAHNGTLFLDEIGDLPIELQGKLLKVLEDKRMRRLGSVREIQVDVRIIAATHVDLAAAVREKRFREDLYYRLNVVPLHLPPLRDRDDDVLLLAEHFLAEFSREYDAPELRLTNEVRRALLAHSWPGNVRELRNAVERAVLLGNGSLVVSDLFPRPAHRAAAGALPFPAPLDSIERAAAAAMVELHGGNKSAAADALGISRSRLYRLLSSDA